MSVVLITVELILIFWIRLFCWEVGPFHIYSCLWFLLSVLSCYWEVGQLLVIFICEFLWCIYNILLVRSGTIHYLFLLWYLSLVQMVYDFAWLHSIRYFTLCSPFLNEGRSVTNIGMQLCAQLGFMNVCLYLWDSRRDDVTWQRGRLVTWCLGVDLPPNTSVENVTTESEGARDSLCQYIVVVVLYQASSLVTIISWILSSSPALSAP